MKLAIITGGTKGIGKALVHKFAEEGLAIFTCARNKEDLEALQKKIIQKYQIPLYYQAVDLAEKQEVKAFATYIKTFLSDNSIAVLINNAGVYLTGSLLEEDELNLERMWRVNVESIYHLTREIAPIMATQKNGHIFNICSIASQTAYENNGSYCATKFALYGMTKVLRQELKKDNVKVTAILPGATFTNSWDGVAVNPARLIKPSDVAEAVFAAYQLSPQALIEELTIRPQLGDL